MQKRWIIAFCVALMAHVVSPVTPISAAEFDVHGSTAFSFTAVGQAGVYGFFGLANRDNGIFATNFANQNTWLGVANGDIASGSGASKGSMSTNFFVTITLNEAIKMQGNYNLGGGDLGGAPGANAAFQTNSQWTQWWVTAETPWGLLSYGKRPFEFGTGLQYSSSNRTEDYLALVADYGPFVIGLGAYPWRHGEPSKTLEELDRRTAFWNPGDWGGYRKDAFMFLQYLNGPMDFGIGTIFADFRQGAESQLTQVFRDTFPTRHSQVSEGWIYFKYYTGQLFVNMEADWHYRHDSFNATGSGVFLKTSPANYGPLGQGGSMFKPTYIEAWRYAVEIASLHGPAKVSVLYAWIPGLDRRAGYLIDRQGALLDPDNRDFDRVLWDPDHSNAALMRQYSMILSGCYGSGVNAFGRGGEGYMVDASIMAARLDYAVAANLHTFASFFYANRVSHGYSWGFIRPKISAVDLDVAPFTRINSPDGTVQYIMNRPTSGPGDPQPGAPNIPDDSLGWEVDAGINWQLLSALSLAARVGYWQPGRWFNYASIDRGVTNWNELDSDSSRFFRVQNNWGVNPNRVIDPIFVIDLALTTSF